MCKHKWQWQTYYRGEFGTLNDLVYTKTHFVLEDEKGAAAVKMIWRLNTCMFVRVKLGKKYSLLISLKKNWTYQEWCVKVLINLRLKLFTPILRKWKAIASEFTGSSYCITAVTLIRRRMGRHLALIKSS